MLVVKVIYRFHNNKIIFNRLYSIPHRIVNESDFIEGTLLRVLIKGTWHLEILSPIFLKLLLLVSWPTEPEKNALLKNLISIDFFKNFFIKVHLKGVIIFTVFTVVGHIMPETGHLFVDLRKLPIA